MRTVCICAPQEYFQKYTSLFFSATGVRSQTINLIDPVTLQARAASDFQFLSVTGADINLDALETQLFAIADIIRDDVRASNTFTLLGNSGAINWRASFNAATTILTFVSDSSKIIRVSGVNIVEK